MEIEPTAKGGFRKPISTRKFILNHLETQGLDYIASMHRAYKDELDRLAREKGRKRPYHKPRYHSFEVEVNIMARDGLIEFSGREEESDAPQFDNWPVKPLRRYYQLRRGNDQAR